jgi:hypothetical protein
MARTIRPYDPISRDSVARLQRLSRPDLSLVAWALLGVVIGALVVYGATSPRALALRNRLRAATATARPVQTQAARPAQSQPTVASSARIDTYGSLPDALAGRSEPHVFLAGLPSGPGVVAVGSLSGLRGEIAIVRGARWISYPDAERGMSVKSGTSVPESAAFLAVADVPRWKAQSFDGAIPFERLASEIERRARAAGIDMTRPFPLVIDGSFSRIALNVANGDALGSELPTEQRLRETAVTASIASAEGTIVGFFAAQGGERIIQAGQRMHLHIVLPATERAGHLDSAEVEAGAVLRLPD